jgi:hypothetical protein
MAEVISRIGAVKQFFEKGSTKVETSEMMAFWRACTDQEKIEFSDSAALQLGVTLTQTPH